MDGAALPEHGGEHVPPEVAEGSFGDTVQHAGFQYVYARVGRVAPHLAPLGLFDKPGDPARPVPLHQAVFPGILHPGQYHGGLRAGGDVAAEGRRQVAVGEAVAGEHQEGLSQVVPGLGHAPRRAQGRFLGEVGQLHPEVPTVAEVGAYGVGEIFEGHRRPGDAVGFEQRQGVFHHRPAHDRRHGLGHIAGQRAKPFPLSPRHDDRLHRHTSSEPAAGGPGAGPELVLVSVCPGNKECMRAHGGRG